MLCPRCGAPEQEGPVICPYCHGAMEARELLAINNLEFLLAEMEGWSGLMPGGLLGGLRERYVDRLRDARSGLLPAPGHAGQPARPSVDQQRSGEGMPE